MEKVDRAKPVVDEALTRYKIDGVQCYALSRRNAETKQGQRVLSARIMFIVLYC
jgi:hypothetical protein